MNSLASTEAPLGAVVAPYLSPLAAQDREALARAVAELELSSLAMRLTALVGRQVGLLGALVPAQISQVVNRVAETAINGAMTVALRSLSGTPPQDRRRLHKGLAVIAGAAGGAAGFSGLTIELPFTTTLMLRSIAEIARGEGENLADPEAALACLEVFALGGREAGVERFGDDNIETAISPCAGYWRSR